MASLDFFAVHDDQVSVLEFLFGNTDVRVFDSYSEYGQELREFTALAQIEAAHPIGFDPQGSGFAVTLQLWSPSVMFTLDIRRIQLNPRSCQGHTFRYTIEGGGLIQLYLGGIHEGVIKAITKSHFGHNSPQRARVWGVDEGVDWEALGKLSNKIRYHIGRRLAVAKVPGRPVLSQALALARQGYRLTEAVGWPGRYEVPDKSGGR